MITKQYGSDSTNVGDEGGFAPNITNGPNSHSLKDCVNSIYTALDLIVEAIRVAGYEGKVKIGMDVAASEFYLREEKVYDVLKKTNHPAEDHSGYLTYQELLEVYQDLCVKYPIISIEDGFDEDDFEGWNAMNTQLGKRIVHVGILWIEIDLVGDDITVTNMVRIQNAIQKGCCNSLLLKVNQIGTVTEAIEAVKTCREGQWTVMTSHRSGETEDCFIAHLAVGLHTEKVRVWVKGKG